METMESRMWEESSPSVPVIRVEGPDRRRQMRLCPPVLSAMLTLGEERYIVSIGDISFTGAKIHNAPPGLRVGDTLQLTTALQDGSRIAVTCTIAYVKGNLAQAETGVQFEHLEEAEKQALVSYLQQLLHGEQESADQALVG